jgi:signal transduction histidine kinase
MRVARWWTALGRYGGSLGLTLLVVAGRIAMDPVWGRQSNRHLVFLPTVMLVAWLWGFGPALLATVFSTVAISYFWMEPAHQLLHLSSDLLLFFVLAVAIAGLVHSQRQAGARADAAAKAREQILAVAAHDLRNPLTTIRVNLGALKDAPLDAAVMRRGLAAVDHSVKDMESLIRDLVDANRLEEGAVAFALKEEPVEPIVQETAREFAPLARERGLTLETTAPGPTTTAWCDRSRLRQVLDNLMANALRSTPQGGSVSLRALEQEDRVQFEVKDSGSGIRAPDLPHVFDRYWRTEGKGTGLGLFIAQSLVRAQGGQIEVDSQPGLGARFSFTLPRRG